MLKTQPSGVYKLPNTGYFGDETDIMLEQILESGDLDEVGIPDQMLARFNASDDISEIQNWLDKNVVELIEPIK